MRDPCRTIGKPAKGCDRGELGLASLVKTRLELNYPVLMQSIPRELALHIFGFLDIPSLLKCSLVNKTWQSIANDQGEDTS